LLSLYLFIRAGSFLGLSFVEIKTGIKGKLNSNSKEKSNISKVDDIIGFDEEIVPTQQVKTKRSKKETSSKAVDDVFDI
jgi:hypothetical protein